MKTVTLDALIPREDFEIISTIGNSGNTRNKLTLFFPENQPICDKNQ